MQSLCQSILRHTCYKLTIIMQTLMITARRLIAQVISPKDIKETKMKIEEFLSYERADLLWSHFLVTVAVEEEPRL